MEMVLMKADTEIIVHTTILPEPSTPRLDPLSPPPLHQQHTLLT